MDLDDDLKFDALLGSEVLQDAAKPMPPIGRLGRRNRRRSHRGVLRVTTTDSSIAALGPELLAWETVYNTVRPH